MCMYLLVTKDEMRFSSSQRGAVSPYFTRKHLTTSLKITRVKYRFANDNITIAMGFTGQLLRFDSKGIWSVVVAAEQAGRLPFIGNLAGKLILGGDTLGGATLSRFFAYHVFLIPAFIFALLVLHIYLVFRNGISEPPKGGRLVKRSTYRQWYEDMLKKDGVPFWRRKSAVVATV